MFAPTRYLPRNNAIAEKIDLLRVFLHRIKS